MRAEGAGIPGLQVDPARIIAILKTRIAEESVRSALLEAALEESRQREAELAARLGEAVAARDEAAPAPGGAC